MLVLFSVFSLALEYTPTREEIGKFLTCLSELPFFLLDACHVVEIWQTSIHSGRLADDLHGLSDMHAYFTRFTALLLLNNYITGQLVHNSQISYVRLLS